MKKLFILLLLAISTTAFAQTTDTIKKGKLTLVFINKEPSFSMETKKRLIDAFFIVYPKEIGTYNANSSRLVTFIIDPAYKGVAATSNDIVRFNPDWFVKHPEDIDVVTHEVMHIVQAYGHTPPNTGWVTEGIADYVRNKFGINNEKGNWKLTEFKAGQNYDNSYRITARFLVWIEKTKNPKMVVLLDSAMREGKYTSDIWKASTGKTVDELWAEYAQNPAI